MNQTISTAPASVPIGLRLAPRLDLVAAQDLAQAILAQRGGDLTLDAGQVEHLGALCLQVLAAAAKTWRNDGQNLTIRPQSAAFCTALAVFGVPSVALQTGAPE